MLTFRTSRNIWPEVDNRLVQQQAIYYLPGRGGRLRAGLGSALLERGYDVHGRETVGEFQRLGFGDQLATVTDDLKSDFWHSDGLVLANSFGAYLFLHAQSLTSPFPGRVLLLSPILGGSSYPGGGPTFLPPYPERLMALSRSGELALPLRCEIHVGENDWQCEADRVAEFGSLTRVPVSIVPNAGHQLPKQYVSKVLDDWLQGTSSHARLID